MASRRPGISVCFIIKNGITQGYPFWESLKSCLSFADEIVISEGLSTDGTAEYIKKFISMYSDRTKFRMYTDDWNGFSSPHGEVIAQVTERNMRRCAHEWIYYLQADEVLHPDNSDFVRKVAKENKSNAVMFKFYHFINAWEPLPVGTAAYDYAIRMIRNSKDIKPIGDAWTFGGNVEPTCKQELVPKPIYHLGWVFPKNCDMKTVEHGKLYKNMASYQAGAKAAQGRIEAGKYNSGFALPVDFDDFPDGVARLFGKVQYELPEEAL